MNIHDLHSGQSAIHLRSKSTPLPSDPKPLPNGAVIQPKRARAPSDPFLDTPTPLLHTASPSSGNTTERLLEEHLRGEPDFGDSDEEYMRIWTSPDISNPELLELLKAFPAFVSRRPLPRFPVSAARQLDIEEGEDGGEGKRIHFGTGSIWVSSKLRLNGWNGDWWTRFILWWRRLFC